MWKPSRSQRCSAANVPISPATSSHHDFVGFGRDDLAAVALRQRDDAQRQRHPADDVGRRWTAAAGAAPAKPHQFRRAAADIEQDDARRRRVEQFGAAGRGEPRFGRGIDHLEFEPGFVGNTAAEFLAVLSRAAGLGRDQPRPRDAARLHLVAADQQRLDGARDRGVADSARRGDALAEPDDAGEGVDDAEAVRGRPRHQKAAIIGAEVERRIGGATVMPVRPPVVAAEAVAANAIGRSTGPGQPLRQTLGVEAAGRRGLVLHQCLPVAPELSARRPRSLFKPKSMKL